MSLLALDTERLESRRLDCAPCVWLPPHACDLPAEPSAAALYRSSGGAGNGSFQAGEAHLCPPGFSGSRPASAASSMAVPPGLPMVRSYGSLAGSIPTVRSYGSFGAGGGGAGGMLEGSLPTRPLPVCRSSSAGGSGGGNGSTVGMAAKRVGGSGGIMPARSFGSRSFGSLAAGSPGTGQGGCSGGTSVDGGGGPLRIPLTCSQGSNLSLAGGGASSGGLSGGGQLPVLGSLEPAQTPFDGLHSNSSGGVGGGAGNMSPLGSRQQLTPMPGLPSSNLEFPPVGGGGGGWSDGSAGGSAWPHDSGGAGQGSRGSEGEWGVEPLLQWYVSSVHVPLLRRGLARFVVLALFGGLAFASLAALPHVDRGLEQSVALPRDSYLQPYYADIAGLLRVGPPVFFVAEGVRMGSGKGSDVDGVCSTAGCDDASLLNQARGCGLLYWCWSAYGNIWCVEARGGMHACAFYRDHAYTLTDAHAHAAFLADQRRRAHPVGELPGHAGRKLAG